MTAAASGLLQSARKAYRRSWMTSLTASGPSRTGGRAPACWGIATSVRLDARGWQGRARSAPAKLAATTPR